MLFINKETGNKVEVKEASRIAKLRGYPDKFEEVKVQKDEKPEEIKEKSAKADK